MKRMYWYRGRMYDAAGLVVQFCTWADALQQVRDSTEPIELLKQEPRHRYEPCDHCGDTDHAEKDCPATEKLRP